MPLLPSDKPLSVVEECKARFKIAEDAESENRENAIDDLDFANGNQWPGDISNARKTRPTPVINHTNTFVRRIVNNLKSLRPRIKVHPTGDGARIEDAEVVNGLERHIENRSSADVAYDTAGESAVRIGWGYARVLTEYIDEKSFDQEIRIDAIRNVFTVYIDPNAKHPTACDARWCIVTGMMKRDTYKDLYPGASNAEYQEETTGDQDYSWESKEEIRLAEYYRIQEVPEKLYRLVDGSSAYASDFKDDAELQSLTAKDKDGKPVYRNSFKRTVEWYRINGEKEVEKRVLPGRFIPVVRCEGNVLDLNGKIVRKGMIRDLRDPQRNFNYMTAAKIERLALTPKAPWLAEEQQLEGNIEQWQNANQANYSVLTYKAALDPAGAPIPPPSRLPPAQVEAGFAEAMQSAEHDLMAIAGMPHEPGQDAAGEVVSGVALQQRQKLSDMTHYQYYDNQTLMIQQIGRIILDWIPVYYDTQRMQRIIGDDGMPEMVQLNQPTQEKDEQGNVYQTIKNDMTVGRYDVVMDTGPGYQTKREESAEAIINLMKVPVMAELIVKTRPDLIVRNLDFAGASDLADSLAVTTPEGMKKMVQGLPKQAQSVVNAMQSQLQTAQQKIQSLEADLKYGLTKTLHQEATKLQVEHLKDKRAEADTHTDTFTKLEDTHTRAQTAISVAEIGATGKLVDSHIKGRFAKEAAEDAAKAAEQAEKTAA
jgi:hypothetical protein